MARGKVALSRIKVNGKVIEYGEKIDSKDFTKKELESLIARGAIGNEPESTEVEVEPEEAAEEPSEDSNEAPEESDEKAAKEKKGK